MKADPTEAKILDEETKTFSPEERQAAFRHANKVLKEHAVPRRLRRALGFKKPPVRRRAKR